MAGGPVRLRQTACRAAAGTVPYRIPPVRGDRLRDPCAAGVLPLQRTVQIASNPSTSLPASSRHSRHSRTAAAPGASPASTYPMGSSTP